MPVIIFNSTHQALAAEGALEAAGLEINIVPVPEGISADCGLAIEFEPYREAAVRRILAAGRIEFKVIVC